MQVRLKVLRGAKAGKVIQLPKPRCLVGRSEECHLRSQMDAISQRHCLITITESEVVVFDLKSLNGTYVNGEKVTAETELRCGDELRIGPLVFEVDIESAKEKKEKQPSEFGLKDVAVGTAGGGANLSTLVVESAKRLKMSNVSPVLDAEPFLQDSLLAEDLQQPLLESGQIVVISGGILQGVTGTVIRRVSQGHYLVALRGQKGPIWAKLPVHLLRAA